MPYLTYFGCKCSIPGARNNCPHFYFDPFRALIKINGLVLTGTFTNPAFLVFEVETAFIDVSGLREFAWAK